MKDFFSLFRSCRSRYVFFKESPFHKIACLGTTIELLYRIMAKRKMDESTEVFRKFIQPESICFDIGAAYGRHTFLISRLASKGHVYSFEPEDYSYRVLSNLIRVCRLKNVTPEKKALYSEETTLNLRVPLKKTVKFVPHLSYLDVNSSRESESQLLERVESVVFDDYCAKKNILKIDFIKCDVEGAELLILKGARKFLLECRPVIYMEVIKGSFLRFNSSFQEIKTFFQKLDYETFIFEDNKFKNVQVSEEYIDYFFVPLEKKEWVSKIK